MAGDIDGGISVKHQGHHGCDGPVHAGRVFSEGPRDGETGRAEETELVVRRHRRMGKEKGKEPERNPEVVPEVVPEGVPEVEPEASCDVEMTLQ